MALPKYYEFYGSFLNGIKDGKFVGTMFFEKVKNLP